MIIYKTGNILHEEVQALVNTVNCVGVMGRGIALQFKKAYPENFKAYVAACKQDDVRPGKLFIFQLSHLTNPQYIINFPTKRHWQEKSREEDIDSGLVDLVKTIRQYDIRSIAIPPLGCGLGGLDWTIVQSKIEKSLKCLPNVQIVIFEPKGAPSSESMSRVCVIPKMTPGRAALIELMSSYLHGLLDPFITLLEIHKLLYFMQEAGEPLRLKYQKEVYGPYAENLRHVLNEMEGHYISGYADGGDNPEKQLTLVSSAKNKAADFLRECLESRQRVNRVSELVKGFESPFGLELLSTVHWVIKYDNAQTLNEVIRRVHAWSTRKSQMFSSRQIEIAVKTLTDKQWIEAMDRDKKIDCGYSR